MIPQETATMPCGISDIKLLPTINGLQVSVKQQVEGERFQSSPVIAISIVGLELANIIVSEPNSATFIPSTYGYYTWHRIT